MSTPGPAIVVFGRRAVAEALAAPTAEIEGVAVARETPASYRAELAQRCRARNPALAPELVPAAEISRRTAEPRHDQGVAALVRLTLVTSAERYPDTLAGASARRPTRLLAFDNITNPQNIGMIVRSAVAAGMAGVLWPSRGVPWIGGLVIKASASAALRCPILRCAAVEEGLWALQSAGFRVIGLDMAATPSLFDHAPPHRAVYVVGGETAGLGEPTRGTLDEAVRIPMAAGVESLNAAIAASLVCFHAGPARAG